MLQMIKFISHPSSLFVRLWLLLLEFPFRPFCWSGLVQVRNPVILRTKVFPTSSNFRRSRRSSGGGEGGWGSPGSATGVSYYFWRSLVDLAQCWDLWSQEPIKRSLYSYISNPKPFLWRRVFSYFIRRILKRKQTTTTGKKIDKATVLTDTA